MKYLIDTDILSYYLRGKYNLLGVFANKGFQNIRTSRVTIAELEVLAYKNPESKVNLSSIQLLSKAIGILEVDQSTWRIFSITKAEISKRGITRGDMDILIASTAKQYEIILVTNNISHYNDLVAVENWLQDKDGI